MPVSVKLLFTAFICAICIVVVGIGTIGHKKIQKTLEYLLFVPVVIGLVSAIYWIWLEN